MKEYNNYCYFFNWLKNFIKWCAILVKETKLQILLGIATHIFLHKDMSVEKIRNGVNIQIFKNKKIDQVRSA